MGMVLHHKAMGKVFRLRCMHIPANDRTPYEELVKFVGEAVEAEHASSPDMPIYLVGDSFGGCLAVSVAAAYPSIDIVLILVNPGEKILVFPSSSHHYIVLEHYQHNILLQQRRLIGHSFSHCSPFWRFFLRSYFLTC